ncbi:von Willebrand factor type A domain-containing protein [Flavobacterium sp. DG1-102-2]|uniref:YfbK domain-containing protein n=1 Tax=Flavobacterium sp. DG1-102-2 TaxID=3081663 RepID=UPI00294A4CA0|nr:von Willebrand factor type A domain-containing protein [Flavobacterium sp. DG1-102-2]MDV6169824.1 von Willebrand factor type A domain-containing protein [Flavobacterium sp. DG1-102-2]
MENQDKIYQQFKEAAGRTEDKGFARMDAVWNRVEEKLDNEKQRSIANWWKYTGIAAVFLLFMFVGVFLLNNEKDNPVAAPKVTPQNNVTVIDTQKVKKTFDPVKTEPKEAVVSNEAVKSFYDENATVAKANSEKVRDSIRFNTQFKKALVWNSRSDKGEFRVAGTITKRADDSVYFIKGQRFVTSKKIDDPEYYFYTNKITLVPGEGKPNETDALAKGYAAASPTGDVNLYSPSYAEKSQPVTANTFKQAESFEKDKISASLAPLEIKGTKTINGVITDSQGLPVPGVSVAIAGTTKAVSTDIDGKYTIDAKEGEKLLASMIGMQQQVVAVGKQKDINIRLQDDAQALQEVVVEGYRSTTRATSNIAVTTITPKVMEKHQSKKERKKAEEQAYINNPATAYVAAPTQTYRGRNIQGKKSVISDTNISQGVATVASKVVTGQSNANFVQTLQGQTPGLAITTGSGEPGTYKLNSPRYLSKTDELNGTLSKELTYGTLKGQPNAVFAERMKAALPGQENNLGAGTTTILRGFGSNSADPLYVIDGVPVSADNFKNISRDDIVSMSILRDDEASSLYGNRGSNGVILVKTKKGLSKKELRRLKREEKKKGKAATLNPEYIKFMQTTKPTIEVDQEEYENFAENQFENPATTPLSTFSIDVDNASYTNIRRFLNNGETVPKDAVRVEEMINFFKYQYPQPVNNEPFSINTEYSVAPWNTQHKLLKVGLQGKIIPDGNLPASNFVFLIDVSGSMDEANRLPLLKRSMKLLVNQMRKKDKIAIIVYAGAAGLVLPSTSGEEKEKIYTALDNLSAGGSTAGGAGIELAYKTAQENFAKGGNNRVILATDGDFNVGASSNSDMQTLIEEKRKNGVFLTCLGYGMGNYKDSKLETLADKGNGNYAYIDNMQEADRYLNKEFKGSMYAIAKDVKIQIEFNPKYVQSYRLIGYENRKLRDEDFANDAIDAGELGSGHTVTALYEIIPTGIKSEFFNPVSELKYSQPSGNPNQYSDELATIKFRSKKPDEDRSTEIVKIIPNNPLPLNSTSADYKFSAAVAWFGLKLRDSKLVPNKKTDDIKALAKQGLQNDTDGYRAEFIRLVEMVK